MRFKLLDLIWLTTVVGLVIALMHAHQSSVRHQNQLEQVVSQLELTAEHNRKLEDSLVKVKVDLQQTKKNQYMFEAWSGGGIYLADVNRKKEAAAKLEVAHGIQPENLCVVDKLIEIYETLGLQEHADKHRRKKNELAQTLVERPVIVCHGLDAVWP